jgi:hypothetical protein
MHSGNVGRIFKKRVKHSATSRVYTLLSYSPNIPRVHYHTISARDLNKIINTRKVHVNVTYCFIIKCRFKFSKVNIIIFSTDVFEIIGKPATDFIILFLSMASSVMEEEF